MTVLFLTTILPGGRGSGSEIASAAFIDALRQAGHRVIVLGYARKGTAVSVGPEQVVVGARHIETRAAGALPLVWMTSAVARGLPYSAAKYRSRAYRRTVVATVREHRPALVIADHAQIGWALPSRQSLHPPPACAYLAHNVEHDLYLEAATRSRPPKRWAYRREARKIMSAETALTARADGVWALSELDAEKLRGLLPGSRPSAFSLPAGVEPVPGADKLHDVGLLGTWTWEPNALGLQWFVEEVLPSLPGDLSVAVAGTGAEGIVRGNDRIEHLGRVPSAAAFLASARVIAVPSTAGAGVQVKTLDAIATRSAVVATPVAVRGISHPPPTVTTEDDPLKFARAIEDAVRSPPQPAATVAAGEWVAQRRQRFVEDVDRAARSVVRAAGNVSASSVGS